MITCKKCNTLKERIEFYSSSYSTCKKCRQKLNKEWVKRNKDQNQDYQKKYHSDYRAKRNEKLGIIPARVVSDEEKKRKAQQKMEQKLIKEKRKAEQELVKQQRNRELIAQREEAKAKNHLKKKKETKAKPVNNEMQVPASIYGTDHFTPRPRSIKNVFEFNDVNQKQTQLRRISDYFNADFFIFDPRILGAISEAKAVIEDDHEATYVTITYRVNKKKRMYAEDLNVRNSGENRPPRGREQEE